jgi:hypothetical protein
MPYSSGLPPSTPPTFCFNLGRSAPQTPRRDSGRSYSRSRKGFGSGPPHSRRLTSPRIANYLILRNRASGTNIVYFMRSKRPLPNKENPLERVMGFAPLLCQRVCGGRSCLDPPNKRFPARKLHCMTEHMRLNCESMTPPAALEQALRPTKPSALALAMAVASS